LPNIKIKGLLRAISYKFSLAFFAVKIKFTPLRLSLLSASSDPKAPDERGLIHDILQSYMGAIL